MGILWAYAGTIGCVVLKLTLYTYSAHMSQEDTRKLIVILILGVIPQYMVSVSLSSFL